MRRQSQGFLAVICCALLGGFGCAAVDAGMASFQVGPRHDHRAPKISDMQVVVNRPGVEVGWKTDEYSDSAIYLSTSIPSSSAVQATEHYPEPLLQHWISLDGLAPSTTYYFYVISRDYGANTVISDVRTFQTPPIDSWY